MAQCSATSKATGNQCRSNAIDGATVCYNHGGNAPQVRRKAAERVARRNLEGEVGRMLEKMGAEPVPDLLDGLLVAVEHCARMVAVYRLVIAERDPLGVNRHGEQVADPGVVEYRNWIDEWARLTKLALDAGIDERRTRLVEADARRMFDLIGAAFDAAGLSVEQRAAFRQSLAAGLRAIDAA